MQPELVTNALDTSTLLKTLIAFRDGDFSARLPVDQTGLAGKIADTLNDIFKLNERMASEFSRISSAVGKEGKINQRATLGAAISWRTRHARQSSGWALTTPAVSAAQRLPSGRSHLIAAATVSGSVASSASARSRLLRARST